MRLRHYYNGMDQDREELAKDRIDSAIMRIEKALLAIADARPSSVSSAAADAKRKTDAIAARHEQLKARVSETLVELDRVIGGLSR